MTTESLILVGLGYSGKTSLATSLLRRSFQPEYTPTKDRVTYVIPSLTLFGLNLDKVYVTEVPENIHTYKDDHCIILCSALCLAQSLQSAVTYYKNFKKISKRGEITLVINHLDEVENIDLRLALKITRILRIPLYICSVKNLVYAKIPDSVSGLISMKQVESKWTEVEYTCIPLVATMRLIITIHGLNSSSPSLRMPVYRKALAWIL